MQAIYGRYVVDLREGRWSFLNTLFSVSEATLYLQLVDRLDDGSLLAKGEAPFQPSKCDTYSKLFKVRPSVAIAVRVCITAVYLYVYQSFRGSSCSDGLLHKNLLSLLPFFVRRRRRACSVPT